MTESVVSATLSTVNETSAGLQPTPGQLRTAKARRDAARLAQQRRADWLIARGWTCTPPDDDDTEE
jgi:hypothetical protein